MKKAITSSNQSNMEVQVRCLIEKGHVKCTRQPVLTAVKSAKCRSNLTPADQSTAESVGLREDHREGHDTRINIV